MTALQPIRPIKLDEVKAAQERIASIHHLDAIEIQAAIRSQPVDAAALVFHLAHDLTEAAVLLPDEVDARDPHVVEEDLAEVTVAGHVENGSHRDTGGRHIDDELREPSVLGRVGVGTSHEVTPVRMSRA